jgi:hypothetical protein
MIYLFSILILFSINAHSQQCSQEPQSFAPVSKMHKTFIGTKCNSLDRNTWDESWKTPCDCLHQQDLTSKMKRRIHKKEEQRKLNNIDQRVEKKIADVFKTQIFTELEQSLRLDIYLKKGIVGTKRIGNGSNDTITFPESCRIDKIGELISDLHKPEAHCNNPRMNDRLKLLFGEGGEPKNSQFQNWKDSQMKLFENTVMNKISDDDRKEGMCVPYKTFLSLNSTNNLRTTYLKIAKAKKNSFKDFQMWASDRYAPNDTANIIGTDEARDDFDKQKTGSALDFLKPGYSTSFMSKQIAALNLKIDDKSEVEPISSDDIQHLIKTDPIFERMIRDPQFFKAMTEQDLSNFNPNDPKIIKLISVSQNNQCKQMYGKVNSSSNEDSEAGPRKNNNGQGKSKTETQPDKNLLTRFLCEENFPRDFIDEGVITSNLAPEFKKELNLASDQEASDYLVDYLYCQDKDIKKRNIPTTNEDVSADVSTVFLGIPKNDDIKNLLNLSLNPKSDIESNTNTSDKKVKPEDKDRSNEYKKFNLATCKHVDDKCKNADAEKVENAACGLAALSTSVAMEIVKTGFPEKEQTLIGKKVFDTNISDKELRAILSDPKSFLTKDQIDSIIIIRHQNTKFAWKDVAADLKKETNGQMPPDGIDPVAYIYAHRHEIKDNPNISDELKSRIFETGKIRSNNSVASEKTTDDSSSYFANYFVLADSTNETHVATSKSSSGNTSSGLPTTPNTSGALASTYPNENPSSNNGGVNIGNVGTTPNNTPGSISGSIPEAAPVYQRKDFGTPTTPTIPVDSKKNIAVAETPKKEDPAPTIAEKPVSSKASDTPKKSESSVISGNNNLGSGLSGLTLTQNSNGGNSGGGGGSGGSGGSRNGDNLSQLEKQKRDLENQLDKLNDEADDLGKKVDNNSDNRLSDLDKEKQRLTDEYNKLKNNNSSNGNGSNNYANNNQYRNNNNWNNNGSYNGSNNSNNDNSPFNNGYRRGEEFDKEKMNGKIDDGSEKFDPDSTTKLSFLSRSFYF